MGSDWSKDAITFKYAEKHGKKLGSYSDWKHGLPGELWEIEVFRIKKKLYGGVRYMGKLEPMLMENEEEILKSLKEPK